MTDNSVRLRDALRYVAPNSDPNVREAEAAQLEALYGAKGRYYHTLDHAIDVAERAWLLAQEQYVSTGPGHWSRILVAAALFHDAIYTPGSVSNETRSADHAVEALWNMNFEPSYGLADVRKLILITKHHRPPHPENIGHSERIIIDADLWRLADRFYDPGGFSDKRAAVFREFGYLRDEEPFKPVPASFYRARSDFWQEFLDRDQIFYTESGKLREKQARDNLAREIRLNRGVLRWRGYGRRR